MKPDNFAVMATMLAAPAWAQSQNYTVWSSFVFLRSGDHTPAVLSNVSQALTSLGALQMQEAGQFFRAEYLDPKSSSKIASLNVDEPAPEQVDILTPDVQFTAASAQAFMLGMYPPTTAGGGNSSSTTLDSTDILANGSVIQRPLNGITFPLISTAGTQDIASLSVTGDSNCPAFDEYSTSALQAPDLVAIKRTSQADYDSIQSVLDPVFPRITQNFVNAQLIFDFVEYQFTYNRTAMELLRGDSTLRDRLRYYADAQQRIMYTNLTAPHPWGRKRNGIRTGSISNIAGASLAARISTTIYTQMYVRGSTSRLTVLAGDHAPMISLFALMGLPSRDNAFNGLPLPGSAMVFELVTPAAVTANLTAQGLPHSSELSVRFRFRNGTGISATTTATAGGADLQTWPIFNGEAIMPYSNFVMGMNNITITGAGEWCQQCGAATIFCAPWNDTLTVAGGRVVAGRSAAHAVTPYAAGGIGAVVALATAAIVAALLFWVVGLRLHRTEPLWVSSRRKRHDLGGFKGSRKLASDADLTGTHVSKDGTIIGASIRKRGDSGASSERGRVNRFSADATDAAPGHERLGSWELKTTPTSSPQQTSPDATRQGGWGHGQGGLSDDELEFYKPGWPLGRRIVRDSEGTLVDRDMGHMGLDGARMGFGSIDQGSWRPTVAPEPLPEEQSLGSDDVTPDTGAQGERDSGMMDRQSPNRMSADSDKVDPFRDPQKAERS